MNNKPETKIGYISPLKRICMTIGELPTSYLETMTYYEMLVWFVEFLKNKVIPVVNNNSEATEELQNLFIELQNYVNNYFDNLDVQEEINNKLDEMVEDGTLQKIIGEEIFSNIIYNNNQEKVLYTFFDASDNNKIHFFLSDDGFNLEEIKTNVNLYGRDPSIMYYNGKYYLTYTSNNTERDFVVWVSEDLNNWTQHDINIGLYDETYFRRWSPEWFIDDNDKIYILIAVQYSSGGSGGYGQFKIYKSECTNIESLTFDSPVEMVLTGSPHSNHIDPVIIKENNVYNLFVKSDDPLDLNLERFTSIDLLNWQYIESDPGNLGDTIEAPIVYKLNNKIYLGGEKYTRGDARKSYYLIKNTTDFISYSGEEKILNVNLDISHGSAVVLPTKILNKLLNYDSNRLIPANNGFNKYNSKLNHNHILIAGGITIDDSFTGELKGDYIKLFSVESMQPYKYFTCCFQLSDVLGFSFDSVMQFSTYFGQNRAVDINRTFMNEISSNFIASNCNTLAGKLIQKVNDNDNKKIDVYLNLKDMSNQNNKMITLTLFSNNSSDCNITYYHDLYEEVNVVSNLTSAYYSKTFSSNSKNIYLNNTTHTSFTFKCVARNGVFSIKAIGSSLVNTKYYNLDIVLLNGNGLLINNNSNLSTVPTLTVDNYNTDTHEYTITISNFGTHSAGLLKASEENHSYFTSFKYN